MKQKIKILLLILGTMTFFFTCQKDDSPKETVTELKAEDNIQVKKVTLEGVKHNTIMSKSLDKIEGLLDINKAKRSSLSRITSADNSFIILTDEIIQVTANRKVSYAFGIEIPTDPNSSFENFVIEQLEDDSILFYIYRYREIDDDTIEDEDAFTVSRELIDSDNINIGDFEDYMGRVYYDPESDCYFTASTINGVLVITITSCGSNAGTNDSSNNTGGSSGNYGEWVYYDVTDNGNCLRTRAILDDLGNPLYNANGTPLTQTEFNVNCPDSNGVADDSQDDPTNEDENTDPNYDSVHDDIPEGGGGPGTTNGDNGNSNTSTVGVVRKTPSEFIIDYYEIEDHETIGMLSYGSGIAFSQTVYSYLKQARYSPEVVAFGELAIEEWLNGGEILFDKGIIFDNTWSDFPCHKAVIFDALAICSPLTETVQNVFENNDFVNLILSESTNVSENTNAITDGFGQFTSPNSYNVEITFRESYLENATDLSIARTAIHESLHAIFVICMKKVYLLLKMVLL